MKQLLLVRHAKSSWDNPGLKDMDRPLNERGKRDAPFMANYCKERGLKIDHILSSPAKRAYKTAKKFHKAFPKSILDKETDLYFGSMEDWLYLIQSIPESTITPAFFSHNPTITYFANTFKGASTDNVVTCGVVRLESTANTWADIDYNNTEVVAFYFPKEVR
ncbi:histidine phosphatase family protein [Saprospiraceae bacterium]|nr:histidine phosphatase family protein [Saprospiraceae bacterium]